jgi:hypothetical protein
MRLICQKIDLYSFHVRKAGQAECLADPGSVRRRFMLRQFRFIERKIDGHRTVIGDWLWQTIVQIAHGSGKVRRKTIWSFQVPRALQIGFHEEPIELKLGNANFAPNQLCHERWSNRLSVDYRNGGFIYDTNMNGTLLGLAIRLK